MAAKRRATTDVYHHCTGWCTYDHQDLDRPSAESAFPFCVGRPNSVADVYISLMRRRWHGEVDRAAMDADCDEFIELAIEHAKLDAEGIPTTRLTPPQARSLAAVLIWQADASERIGGHA